MAFRCGEQQLCRRDRRRKIGSLATALNYLSYGDTLNISAGTYTDNLTIDASNVTIQGAGKGETIIAGSLNSDDYTTEGKVTVSANNVTFKDITFEQAYEGQVYSVGSTLFCVESGDNLVIDNCEFNRIAGYLERGYLVYITSAGCKVTITNTEMVAPVPGDASYINSVSPSVIGDSADGTTDYVLEMENCIVATNGFGIFRAADNAAFTNTTFTGLDEVAWIDDEFKEANDIRVTTLYMALNDGAVENVTFDGCFIENTRSWGMLIAEGNITVNNCYIRSGSRAISASYGTVTNLTITNNIIDLSDSSYGIKFDENSLDASSEVTIDGNTFANLWDRAGTDYDDEYAVSNLTEIAVTVTNSIWDNCDETADKTVGVVTLS